MPCSVEAAGFARARLLRPALLSTYPGGWPKAAAEAQKQPEAGAADGEAGAPQAQDADKTSLAEVLPEDVAARSAWSECSLTCSFHAAWPAQPAMTCGSQQDRRGHTITMTYI
jgi:hypothetical protein